MGANGNKSSEKAPSDFEKEKAGNDSDNDIGNELSSKQNEGNKSLAEMDIAEYRDPGGGIRIDGIYIAPPPPPSLTFEADGPRLVITHIENENFKSYAGLQ